MVVECVWAFVMDGEALSGAVAASMVYDKIMRVWRWREPGEGSKLDDLADVQSMDEVMSYSHSSTIFTNMVSVLCHLTIILNMDVENLSQLCLAIFWGPSVIEIVLLVMPMLYKSYFHSHMCYSWSSQSCACGDDIEREAVLQESFGSIMYSYSRSIVSFRVCLCEVLQILLLPCMLRGVRPFINSTSIHSLTYIVPGNPPRG